MDATSSHECTALEPHKQCGSEAGVLADSDRDCVALFHEDYVIDLQ